MGIEVMNAQIERVDLGFREQDIEGNNGKNFVCFMSLSLANGGSCIVDLNPARLPEFMELLDVRSFYDIEGKYLQVKCEDNLRPDYVKSILAKKFDEWFDLATRCHSRLVVFTLLFSAF